MLPLVRRYIKTSFVFLALGLLLGGWISISQFLLGAGLGQELLPAVLVEVVRRLLVT